MITGNQARCIELMMHGLSNKEISEKIGVAQNTITKWLKKDDFQIEYRKAILSVIGDTAKEALDTIIDLMRNGKTETVRLKASQDLLSRAGFDAEMKNRILTDEPLIITVGIYD